MKALLVIVVLILLNLFVTATNYISCNSDCLSYRNDIITVSDENVSDYFKDKFPKEIDDLRQIIRPKNLSPTTPRQEDEKNQYEVIAKIKCYYKFTNGCYKVVLYQPDDTISSISAIIINPNCVTNKNSQEYNKIVMAYESFNKVLKTIKMEKNIYYRFIGGAFFSNEFPTKKECLSNGVQLAPIFNVSKF